MLFTSYMNFLSSLYLSRVLQLKVDCFYVDVPSLGTMLAALLLCLEPASAPVPAIAYTVVFATSMSVCVIACVIACVSTIFFTNFCQL